MKKIRAGIPFEMPCACHKCIAQAMWADGWARCTDCSKLKSITEFNCKSNSRAPLAHCKPCAVKRSTESKQRRLAAMSPAEKKAITFTRRLKRFNMSEVDFWQRLGSQGGQCVCGQSIDEATLFIDHDHSCCPNEGSCGECIRGFLCINCNTALGHIKDRPETAIALAQYLYQFQNVIGAIAV